jgi:hypothetical protein
MSNPAPTPVLDVPRLAQCQDRSVTPRMHRLLGEPPEWFSAAGLAASNLAVLSFDFFVRWSDMTCGDEIWIKRIAPVQGRRVAEERAIYLDSVSPAAPIDEELLVDFSERYDLQAVVQVFRDGVDWIANPDQVVRVELDRGGIREVRLQSIGDLMDSIRTLRRGEAPMGAKGLRYGTSTLECYLSATDALWPGDIDMVLWRSDSQRAVALFEWKKHNLSTPLAEQTLSNYYPRPDGRKYDAIAALRERLDNRLPIFAVYYPTAEHETEVKVELVRGEPGNLSARGAHTFDAAGIPAEDIGAALLDAARALLRGERDSG